MNGILFSTLLVLFPAGARAASTGTASAVDQPAPPAGGAITLFGNPAVMKDPQSGAGQGAPAETGRDGEKKPAKKKKLRLAENKPQAKELPAAGGGTEQPEKKKLVPVTLNSKLPFKKSCDDCPCRWALGQIFDIVGGYGAPPVISSVPINAFRAIGSTEMPKSLRMGKIIDKKLN